MSEQKPILSVRIDQNVLDRLDELVERTGVGRAEIVERCLSVGIADQEQFVSWLESSVKGPMLSLLMHPTVLNAIISLTGSGEIDETQQKVARNVRGKRKTPAHAKLAT